MELSIDSIPLVIKVWEDGTSEEGPFLAYSSDLKLVAAGKTGQEAKEKLIQIVADILIEEEENGTIKEFLQQMGFRPENGSKWIAPEVSLIQIPLNKTDSAKN